MSELINTTITIIRRKQVEASTGNARSTIYDDVKSGTLTTPIKIGVRASGWPSYEIDAINTARIAGMDKDQIRALVVGLESARTKIAGKSESEVRAMIADLFESARMKAVGQ